MRTLPLALLLSSSLLLAQTPAAPQTPTGIAAQAIEAFSAMPVSEIQLSGTAKAYAGSWQPRGTFTAKLQSSGESRLQLNLAELSRTETVAAGDDPACRWTGANGVQHDTAPHNCFLSANWIAPLLSLQSQQSALLLSSNSSVDSSGDQQLIVTRPVTRADKRTAQMIQRLSTTTYSLDPQTLQLASLSFNTHPEDDAGTDIPIVVRYSDYRQVSGASIPFRIQKYLNNGLVLDLQVETAEVR